MDDRKNNFDDIILDKTNKSEKIKKILLRVIALAILFLVVMIVMKLINSDDVNKEEAVSQGIFPAEPQSPQAQNFEPTVPITQTNSTDLDDFEELRRKLQGLDENTSTDLNLSTATPLPQIEEEPVEEPKDTKTQDAKPQVAPAVNSAQSTKPAEVAKPTTKTTNTDNKASSDKKESPKKTTDAKDLFDNVKTNDAKIEAGSYIQVFSVAKFDPKSRELSLLQKNGYQHKLYKATVNGKELTRVLVGPFSKDELNDELKKIRENVQKDAFIFQVK
ncbi:SPOR domain-containing protein [Campylobacter avium]|uniref:SPOR domain-containing protein n=1 Tax=Campylobacter avium TaxID=522485 RepID=UPI0023541809|nr:SPOR domain-containing protein [Campylobacter avium]